MLTHLHKISQSMVMQTGASEKRAEYTAIGWQKVRKGRP